MQIDIAKLRTSFGYKVKLMHLFDRVQCQTSDDTDLGVYGHGLRRIASDQWGAVHGVNIY